MSTQFIEQQRIRIQCSARTASGNQCRNSASYLVQGTEYYVCHLHTGRAEERNLVPISQLERPQLLRKASSYPNVVSQEGLFFTPQGSPTETPVKKEEEEKLPVEYLITPATTAQPSRTLKREVSFKTEKRRSIEPELEEAVERNRREAEEDFAAMAGVLSRQVSQISEISQFPLDDPFAELESSISKLENSYSKIPQMIVPEPDVVRTYQEQQQEILNYQVENDVVTLRRTGEMVPTAPTEQQRALEREQFMRERLGIPRLEVPIPVGVLQNMQAGLVPLPQVVNNQGTELLKKRISLLHPVRQKRYTDLFNSLNQYIGDIVRARDYIDTNYIFGQIQSEFGDVFDPDLIHLYLVPVFDRMEAYNNAGFGMIGYNPVDLRFVIIVPEQEKKLFVPPPQNVLPGTNKEIIFENIPDGGSFSQFMGKYGNIKHPEFPVVELTTDKKVISDRYVCTQKVGGKLKSRRFSDVYQAKGWALRGGFYADKIEQMRKTKIQGRYDNKFRVIPSIRR